MHITYCSLSVQIPLLMRSCQTSHSQKDSNYPKIWITWNSSTKISQKLHIGVLHHLLKNRRYHSTIRERLLIILQWAISRNDILLHTVLCQTRAVYREHNNDFTCFDFSYLFLVFNMLCIDLPRYNFFFLLIFGYTINKELY